MMEKEISQNVRVENDFLSFLRRLPVTVENKSGALLQLFVQGLPVNVIKKRNDV